MSARLIYQHSFRNCEQFSQAMAARRQTTVTQISLQSFRCDLLLVEFDHIQVAYCTKLSVPVRVIGGKGHDSLEFAFILQTGQQELFSHRFAVPQGTIFGFDPTREVNLIVPENTHFCVVQIQQPAFELCTQIMERTDLDAHFLKTNYVCRSDRSLGVHAYLKELYCLATHHASFLKSPESERILFEDFLPQLVDALPPFPSRSRQALCIPRRFDLVEQANEYMHANLQKSFTLMDLCKALNTSKRPLNYGFQEVFGISPMAYLKALRLRSVRRQLQTADPTTTVIANVAHQYGFWSLGHFSRDYKTMFGELPSETLKQG
ncbi:helix-turn-helix domain-containing protein [Egbenema bharatensis]|uniref:helix-turn-helix domain-containing protein n=1 Tax=Egbenema bharatensis TaxID=3463334 RepID=UPI003A852AA5